MRLRLARLARLAAGLLLAASLVPADRAAAAPAQPIAQAAGCPGPDCVLLTQEMRCHEDGLCLVNGWLKQISTGPVALDVSVRDITTVPGEVRLRARTVVVPPEAREFQVEVVVVARGVARAGDEAFELRVGNAVTVVIVTARR
jgi:hypothetical protein